MIRPQLRTDLSIVEQTYRGEQSFIVKEHAAHKYFRFKLLEILVMQQLDGEHTCAEVAAALAEQGMPLKPAAVEGFARKLDGMGLLEQTVAEKSVLLMERLRAERNRRVKRTHYVGSILRMRWSAGDPNRFFDVWTPRLRFFFSKPFLVLSVLLFVTYFVIVVARAPQFAAALRQLYRPSSWDLQMVVVFWCTAITVIVIHEFGHGFACKYFGGEVHEMGAMLIYFQPAFYCNVNDAWTFPELRARLWVTVAGSWIQMVVAGIAAIVWYAVVPDSLVSQIALVAVLIGGATTVFANANPLIPLDGYYMLSDWLEIPNLRSRAFGYVGWLLRRHVFRLAVPEPPADEREKHVFLVYGLLAFAYSGTILTVIAGRLFGWVSASLGALGAIAFLFLVWSALKRHVRAWAQAVVTSVREHRGRLRSPKLWRPAGMALGLVLLAGFLVPWRIEVGGSFTAATRTAVALVAPEDAVVGRVAASEGAPVRAGAPVLVLRDLALERQALDLTFAVDSLAAREQRARAQGTAADARRLEAAREEAAGALAALRARLALLTLRAPAAGVVVTPRFEDLVGRRFDRGDTVAQLIGTPDTVELRVALERAGATLVLAGQRAAVVPYSDVGAATHAAVTSVAVVGTGAGTREGGQVEARVRVPGSAAYRPGVTGEARITVRRTNVLGALWWAVRKRVRSDLLL